MSLFFCGCCCSFVVVADSNKTRLLLSVFFLFFVAVCCFFVVVAEGPPISRSGYDLTPLTPEEVGSMVDKLTELQKTVLVQASCNYGITAGVVFYQVPDTSID